MKEPKRKLYYEVVTEGTIDYVIQSTFHKATKEEIAEAKRLHKQGKCPHTIFYDTAGEPYDFRTCATCGKGKGTI